MKHILSLSDSDLDGFLKSIGEKPYRRRQIYDWIFKKGARDFGAMANLSAAFRRQLGEHFTVTSLEHAPLQVSSDGTVRIDMAASDGVSFPAVILKGAREGALSVCISSQAGCAVGCAFCASGEGLKRNLTRGEIAETFLAAGDYVARCGGERNKITSVLFMGQGEPLLNYESVAGAISDISSPDKSALGQRHITLSTVGIITGIRRLAADGFKVRLAVSLHAADDDLRKKLIPRAASKVATLLEAARDYAVSSGTRLTFECVMIKGVTDTPKRLEELALILLRFISERAAFVVNLIPFNENSRAASEASYFRAPDGKDLEAARDYLVSRGIFTIIRSNKGRDISSACGQLGV
ncbi:MAG: 23S rRNA (adenine(2503)-C(2))-methyltransferase RlmN [Elusimicrobia bacterium HGW-Elusimicrobia-1]|jgi:23S rRNA (adenine2503-C2)-methyltransferase|nr:MAG: 23S rRNA (adenine(2503)-C(2))-methyltransferase RlmN [Elusimicrobia bacterium HGW-Elusimicrobia-1]